MMRSISILIVFFLLTISLHGQPVNKYIKQKKVAKIINTLAADDMRGRSALSPADINKAAAFIENEFKKAGLQPLAGASSYRQEFQKEKLSLVNMEVLADGKPIPLDRLILSSDAETINLDLNTPIDTIGSSQQLFPSLSAIERKGGNKIVLVASEHEANFRIAQNYLGRPKVQDPGAASGTKSIVYLLGLDAPRSISVSANQKREIITMANVLGILPAKVTTKESVIFSGHYDHIGIEEPVQGDSIANGADDDASGTTAVIALAKYFSKIETNKRNLIFAAFTAEEIGGYGSKYFSKQLDPDNIIAMFNIEMIGKPSKWGQNAAFITGFERSDFGKILQKNLEGTPFQIHPDPYPEQNLFYRSDNATLARLGVPAHSISTDQIPTDPYYHTVNDEVGTLDMANITAAIRGIALSSKSIVEGIDTPTRVDKSQVN